MSTTVKKDNTNISRPQSILYSRMEFVTKIMELIPSPYNNNHLGYWTNCTQTFIFRIAFYRCRDLDNYLNNTKYYNTFDLYYTLSRLNNIVDNSKND